MNIPFRKPKSAEDVLLMLGAKDWRSITKKQYTKLVSNLIGMDKDIALECIRQLPDFMKSSTEIISQLRMFCDNAMKSNDKTVQDAVDAQKQILNSLEWRLYNEPDLTEFAKEEIRLHMVECAQEIDRIRKEKQEFILKMVQTVSASALTVITIGATVIGVSTNGNGIPNNTNNP